MLKSRGTQPNGRNAFDLSNSHAYGMKAGYITPLKCLHTIPEDYFDVECNDFTQTDAMATAAFLRGRKEIAGYFVPYNTIWHNFNQYQSTREDPQSTLLKEKGILFEPRIEKYNLLVAAMELFYHYLYCEYDLRAINSGSSFDRGANADTADFRSWQAAKNSYLNTSLANFDFFVNQSQPSYESEGQNVKIAQLEDFTCYDLSSLRRLRDVVYDTIGDYKWCNFLRKLDMLGYGNWYPLFALAEKGFNAYLSGLEYPIARDDQSDVHHVLNDVMYYLARKIVTRIYGFGIDVDDVPNQTRVYLSVYPLYAYNHIFYTMFRNSYYDLAYDPRNFNVDFINGTTLLGSVISFEDIPIRWYNLECHQWKKDKFTAIMPDTQFGAVSNVVVNTDRAEIVGNIGYDTGQWQGNFGTWTNIPSTLDGSPMQVDSDNQALKLGGPGNAARHSHSVTGYAAATTGTLNVLALKRAEALQQYRQDLLRAGNHTQDIFKQLYGSTPKSQLDEHSYFVDVCGGDVIIDPVVATASTGQSANGSLGDIAARALVNSAGKFKLSVSDFGCFIFLTYIVPESMYNSFMIDQHLMNLTQEDHFIPQLMNLGFEPLTNESLNCLGLSPNLTRGYALPYIEFKTDIDLCHGNYCDYYDEVTLNASDSVTLYPNIYEGSKSHWVAPRTDMQLYDAVTLRNFYIDPRVLNNVFLVRSDCTYETDQFTCFTRLSVNAVRQLSELGLPRFC